MLINNSELKAARESYGYPPFCLKVCKSGQKPVAELWGQPVYIVGPAEKSTKFPDFPSFELDEYHYGLLRSQDDEQVLLGVASVLFWGFASGKDGRHRIPRALSRALAVSGQGKRGADTKSKISNTIRSIILHLDSRRRQKAIEEAMTLRHFGLSFGSKLLAFCAPTTECVYDSVISDFLKDSPDPQLNALHVPTIGKDCTGKKAAAYLGWAQLCTDRSQILNEAGLRWQDWDGQERVSRAVDVERAYFRLKPSREKDRISG